MDSKTKLYREAYSLYRFHQDHRFDNNWSLCPEELSNVEARRIYLVQAECFSSSPIHLRKRSLVNWNSFGMFEAGFKSRFEPINLLISFCHEINEFLPQSCKRKHIPAQGFGCKRITQQMRIFFVFVRGVRCIILNNQSDTGIRGCKMEH